MIKTACQSERGLRSGNEDRCLVRPLDKGACLAAVADGMGGHACGELAAQLCVDTLSENVCKANGDRAAFLSSTVQLANARILSESEQNPQKSGMGCTLVDVLADDTDCMAANVGDSRLYHFHKGEIRQITVDHSFVQSLVQRGLITPKEARTHPRRNIILRAIGTDAAVQCDLFSFSWEKGDLILLCSDGLSGSLTDEQLSAALSENQKSLDELCDQLIKLALLHGSTDNITLVLLQNAEADG